MHSRDFAACLPPFLCVYKGHIESTPDTPLPEAPAGDLAADLADSNAAIATPTAKDAPRHAAVSTRRMEMVAADLAERVAEFDRHLLADEVRMNFPGKGCCTPCSRAD